MILSSHILSLPFSSLFLSILYSHLLTVYSCYLLYSQILLFFDALLLTYSDDLKYFNEHSAKEITVEDILNIEEACRPFKDEKELIEEMNKHTPFGWIQDKYSKSLSCISRTNEAGVTIDRSNISFDRLLKYYTFLDGSICGVS